MKTKTVICHFYNEEYLLPWWLKHHKEIFSDGLMINYGSTDNSIKIIQEICPHWKIVETKNKYFGAIEIDREIEEYEKFIEGYRIVLNVTEFLIGNFSILENIENDLFIPMAAMGDTPYQVGEYPDINLPLTIQRVHGHNTDIELTQGSRILHTNKNIKYPTGRHYWHTRNTSDFLILRYKHSPWNDKFIQRKMQIGSKQPDSDIVLGFGIHHRFSKDQLEQERKVYYEKCVNLKDKIESFEYYRY
jgi:hypothetical protein